MALLLALLAAILCGLSSLFMRKSIDQGGSSKGFLIVQQAFSFIIAILLNPVRTGHYAWNNSIACIGIAAGIIMGLMMFAIGKSLEKGPPGLTIATLNSSTVVPAIVMVLVFGASFGHIYHWWNAVGSLLVIIGLFWAAMAAGRDYASSKAWLFFASLAFILHALFLIVIEWESLLITSQVSYSKYIPFSLDGIYAQWFMPMIFFASTTFLIVVYMFKENRQIKLSECSFGALGGVCNGICTFFLIKATAIAFPWERAMLFPAFAVLLILVCNIWGRVLYSENVHWRANILCLGGIFIGTTDWQQLVSFFR